MNKNTLINDMINFIGEHKQVLEDFLRKYDYYDLEDYHNNLNYTNAYVNSSYKTLISTILHNINITDTYIDNIGANNLELKEVGFHDMYMKNINFFKAKMDYVDFENVKFEDVEFQNCILNDVTFKNVDFKSVSFHKTVFINPDLDDKASDYINKNGGIIVFNHSLLEKAPTTSEDKQYER